MAGDSVEIIACTKVYWLTIIWVLILLIIIKRYMYLLDTPLAISRFVVRCL